MNNSAFGTIAGLENGSYGTRFGKNDRKDKIDAAIALAIAVLAYDKLVGDGGMYGTFNS